MINNVLKLALIGGGAYLAYNYLQKRKANGVAVSTSGAKAPALNNVEIAEGEEEGEEGLGAEMLMDIDDQAAMSNAVGNNNNKGCLCSDGHWRARKPNQSCRATCGELTIARRPRKLRSARVKMSRMDGWDSDNISYGL